MLVANISKQNTTLAIALESIYAAKLTQNGYNADDDEWESYVRLLLQLETVTSVRVVLNCIVKIKLRAMLSLTLSNNTFL